MNNKKIIIGVVLFIVCILVFFGYSFYKFNNNKNESCEGVLCGYWILESIETIDEDNNISAMQKHNVKLKINDNIIESKKEINDTFISRFYYKEENGIIYYDITENFELQKASNYEFGYSSDHITLIERAIQVKSYKFKRIEKNEYNIN